MARQATVIGTASNPQSGMGKKTGKVSVAQNKEIRAKQKKLGLKVGSTEVS